MAEWTRLVRDAEGDYQTDNIVGAMLLLEKNGWSWQKSIYAPPGEFARCKNGLANVSINFYKYIPPERVGWSIAILYNDGKITVHGPDAQKLRDVLEGAAG